VQRFHPNTFCAGSYPLRPFPRPTRRVEIKRHPAVVLTFTPIVFLFAWRRTFPAIGRVVLGFGIFEMDRGDPCVARPSCSSGGPRSEVPECGDRLALAVRISGRSNQPRPSVRSTLPLPPPRIGRAARGHRRGEARRHHEAGQLPHVSSVIRDASARGRVRHSNCSGIARPCGRQHHDDLHTCPQSRCSGRQDSRRSSVEGASALAALPHT